MMSHQLALRPALSRRNWWAVICTLNLLLWPWLPARALAQTVRTLEPGRPIESPLAGGEAQSYRVAAAAGQYLRVVVEQRGIDVAVTLFGPDGKRLIEVDRTDARSSEPIEQVGLVAETAGDYRIEVRAADERTAAGRYIARIETARAATAADRACVAAERVTAEADGLSQQRETSARRQAIPKYEEAIRLWRELGDQAATADALVALGHLHNRLNEPSRAIEAFNQALPLLRAAKNQEEEASVRTALGLADMNQGKWREATEAYTQALALQRALKDRVGESTVLQNLGEAYRRRGEKRKAIKFFEQALALRRATKNVAGEAITLTSLGVTHFELGEVQKALDAYARALPLRRDPATRIVTLYNLGRAYDLLGIPPEALNHYNQALGLARSAANRLEEARTLNFLGLAYWSLAEYQRALDHFNQALPLRRELKDKSGEGATLNNLGLVYSSLGDHQQALAFYHQALPLFRELSDRQGEAYTLTNVGFAYEAIGEREKAVEALNRALQLARQIGDRQREAKIRYGLARIERSRGRLSQARSQIEQTIKIVESLRAKLTDPNRRAEFRASVEQYYEFYIDLLMRMHRRQPSRGFAGTALQASESARARSLLELLTEASADIRQGVAAELVEQERELQQQLNDKTTEQIRLLSGKHTAEQAAAIAQEIEALTTELLKRQEQIRRSSPRYAALTQPQPLSLSAIQQQVLNPYTLLLEYSLGEEQSYLWAVTPTAMTSHVLPKRAEIETAARRFYQLLTARKSLKPTEQSTPQDQELMEAGARLSQMLLGPVAKRLGAKRLLIVADGALHYLPFAALPRPVGSGQWAVGSSQKPVAGAQKDNRALTTNNCSLPTAHCPLIVNHEIVSVPSASTLAVLRREMAARKPAPRALMVLADPVFEERDERVKLVMVGDGKRASEQPAANAERLLLHKSAGESGASDGEFRIPRLPGTRREAEGILALAPAERRKEALDFAASRATATGAELSQHRLIHFATHGFLNSAHPELSGLVLSMVDEQGKPQEGFLRAHEIFNLHLPAELVVLSACQTGLGKEIRGEGLVGLTRGFMYAGAPRVVVSLWNVSDQATAELMIRFYRGMLVEKLRPAAALRKAQIALWKEGRWQAPYYWAAFALQGEWK